MLKQLVINTGPIIALIAALNDLKILNRNYEKVIVPHRVVQEMLAKGNDRADAKIFLEDEFITRIEKPVEINTFLRNSLDSGEASVIQTALNKNIDTVCIDESAGRRIARLNNLKLTGSLGIIISAINNGENIDLKKGINNMRNNGIWISEKLEKEAFKLILNK